MKQKNCFLENYQSLFLFMHVILKKEDGAGLYQYPNLHIFAKFNNLYFSLLALAWS